MSTAVGMGGKWSSDERGREEEEEDVDDESYERLHQLRRHLFPLCDDEEVLRVALKDKAPSLVYKEDNGFRLYIGSAYHAQDIPALQEESITRIVNMAAGSLMTSQELYGEGVSILLIEAEDMEAYDLSKHFDEVTGFIEKGREEGAGVFVHCMAGVSRSVTVTVAFLMKYCNMTLTEAARQVHSNRLLACPNVTFMRNLYNLQKQLQDEKRKKRELATAH